MGTVNRTQIFQALPPGVRRRVQVMRHRLAPAPPTPRGTWCLAPSMQMHLLPDGDIRACCRNAAPLGNIAEQRLPEIWFGPRRAEMREQLAAGGVPTGCDNCAAEIATEGRRGSYPEVFDFWAGRLEQDTDGMHWPTRLEFNLSNRCNLQCIQCSGDLSSSIRIHREGRPALPTVYDDRFFDDLRVFLPHLQHANFAGGEPFLGPENFRVWDLIAEITPDLDCTINTNATQWNRRVEQVLERGRFSFIFSLDGISKDTYESIRIDGDLDVVLANIERFRAYAARRGTDVNINHCLMPQNHHEFADLLLYAEQRRIKVNCSVVRTPRECSIAYLSRDEIREIHRGLKERERDLLPRLRLNASTWLAEVQRIGVWATHGPPPDPNAEPMTKLVEIRARPVEPVAAEPEPAPEPEPPPEPEPMLVGMPRHGVGPTDTSEALAELASFSRDGTVEEVTVGDEDTMIGCSPGLLDLLGVDIREVEGQPLSTLEELTVKRFGALRSQHTEPTGPDRLDGTSVFDTIEARSAIVAVRRADGWADHAKVLIALRRRGDEAV